MTSLKVSLGSTPVLKHLYRPLRDLVRGYERLLLRQDVELKYPPIFVIGPPRCGSTLLSLVMARHFRVSYFSNLFMQFPHNIITLAAIVRYFRGCTPKGDYSNAYGETRGWRGPNQGVNAWKKWFPEHYGYVDPGVLTAEARKNMRLTISHLQRIFDAPFLNKWQVNSARIIPLATVFPEALFIRMKRDPAFIAQSILIGKQELFQDQRNWFSVKPSSYEELKEKEGIDQICHQIHHLEREMDRDAHIVGENRFLELAYDDLCASVHRSMEKVGAFYQDRSGGYRLRVRHQVPSEFPKSDSLKIHPDEFRRICDLFDKLTREDPV